MMRSTRTVLAIPALLGLAMTVLMGLSVIGGTAEAQTGAQTGSPAAEAQAGSQPAAAPAQTAPAPGSAGDEALLTPDSTMREPERLTYKPSGFWTSGRPAVGGAYRYRLLGIGVVVLALTGMLTVWVVRRHPQRRA